jgi:hypothetical protein
MALDDKDRAFIRQNIEARKTGVGPPSAKLGEPAPAWATLVPIPDRIASAIPRLKGYRYYVDTSNGTINIVSPSDNRLAAIVG